MRLSTEDALGMLEKWKEGSSWLSVVGHVENGIESHKFMGRCVELSESALLIVGEFVALRVSLVSAEFELADIREAPEPTRSEHKDFGSSLIIRSGRLSVVLMLSIGSSPSRRPM